jgi:Amt family ammonium transporter
MAGFIYFGYTKLFVKCKMDDPIDAIAVHMGTGMWGAIAVGIFDQSTGFLYGHGGRQLGVQVCAVVVNLLWTGINSVLLSFLFKFTGIFRISEEHEKEGLDIFHFGALVNHLMMLLNLI